MSTEIKLKLLPATIKVLQSTKPTTIFIGGRGSSKSFSGTLKIIFWLIKEPGLIVGAFSPTHSQTASIILPNLIHHCDKIGIEYCYNKQPKFLKSRFQKHDNILSLNLPGSEYASQIVLGQAETYDYQRGKEFDALYCDEIRDFNSEAIQVFLGCLRGNRGSPDRLFPKLYTTTPNGYDYIYSEYIEKSRDDVEIIRSASQDNIFLPQSFFDDLKANYSDKFYKQEVLGEIINFAVGQVITSFNTEKHITTDKIEGDIFLGCDFNLLPMSWVYGKFTKHRVHTYGELHLPDVTRTNEAFELFVSRFPEVKNRTLYLYGDSSGRARSTKSNQSDYDIIITEARKYNIKVINKALTSNPSHTDRINTYNNALEKGIITFDPSCKHLFEDFYNTVWKEGTREIWKSKWDCHQLDASSYMVWEEFRPGTRISTRDMF
jgi:hypothetical protein